MKQAIVYLRGIKAGILTEDSGISGLRQSRSHQSDPSPHQTAISEQGAVSFL